MKQLLSHQVKSRVTTKKLTVPLWLNNFNKNKLRIFGTIWNKGLDCDESVLAGQTVFLGPTTHLPRPEFYVESHHLHSIHIVYCCFQMRSQKRHYALLVPTF